MTTRRRALAHLGALVALMVAASLGVVPAPGADAAPGRAVARRDDPPAVKRQRVVVDWRGDDPDRDYVKTAQIPGIGVLDLICRPNDTRIRLYVPDREYETQMWLAKYQDKPYGRAVAVKNVRVYTYQHDDDDGDGGTGLYAHEGLNQEAGVEGTSQGSYLYGVISQRSGRKRGVSDTQITSPRPVTTFELNWNWRNMGGSIRNDSCTIDATFTTRLESDQRMNLTWHGSDDPAATVRNTWITGIGSISLSCPHDRDVAPSLTLTPADRGDAAPSLYVEQMQGEGRVDEKVDTASYLGSGTSPIGPVPLPRNGMLRIMARNGDGERWFLVSSYFITNQTDEHANRNLCEVAAGAYNR